MHLQQTKRGSRRTGGPQYYFHDLSEDVPHFLRHKKAVPVVLVTPYGATPSSFDAKFYVSPVGYKYADQPRRREIQRKGYDCQGTFPFLDYEPYRIPIEIKKLSSHFKYQQKPCSAEELSRVVILCARHDLRNVPIKIDVIELGALCAAIR